MRVSKLEDDLRSQLVQIRAAMGDVDLAATEVEGFECPPEWTDGYWYGRYVSCRDTLLLMSEGVEL